MPGRTPRRSCITVAIALVVALQTATPAWALGRFGHRVISRLAEKQMTPLQRPPSPNSSDPASRSPTSGSGRTRTVANPGCAARPWALVCRPLWGQNAIDQEYSTRFCGDDPKMSCVVDKVNEFRLIIKEKTKTVGERRFALRLLIHCVEDMHMPCHIGDNKDKGGNRTQVRFFDKGTNMHRLWDSDMIERTGSTEEFWLADLGQLDAPENRESWKKTDGRGTGRPRACWLRDKRIR